jgi:hypothetical protein
VPLCVAISSGLLLYRLLGIFYFNIGADSDSDESDAWAPDHPLEVINPSNPKESIWHVDLVHEATGAAVQFGDYLGGATVWMLDKGRRGSSLTALREHLEALLEIVCSEKSPHTYDGTVAGCVAWNVSILDLSVGYGAFVSQQCFSKRTSTTVLSAP